MYSRIRKSLDHKDKGFTLIELLVVIIIIGILAAIAIPVFLNQRKKANDASLKADLKSVATAMETYYTDYNAFPTPGAGTAGVGAGVLPAGNISVAAIPNLNAKVTGTNLVTLTDANSDTNSYCLVATNTNNSASGPFYYDSDAGGLLSGTTVCS